MATGGATGGLLADGAGRRLHLHLHRGPQASGGWATLQVLDATFRNSPAALPGLVLSSEDLGPATTAVLCHNDLHHLNLVGTLERPLAVDWEYAGRGDGRVDLAQFALAHDLEAGPRAALLAAYDGPAGPLSPSALEAAMRLAAAVNEAWQAVAASAPG